MDSASTRLNHFEDCRGAIDQLFQEAIDRSGESALFEHLDYIRRFPNLSVYNAMLVRLQRPGALAVATRRQWADCGREVLPDAVPVIVLQPFGPVRFLYEVNDTWGEALPWECQLSLFAEGALPPERYAATIQCAERHGVIVEETEQYGHLLAGTASGLGQWPAALKPDKNAPAFRVRLNARHDRPTRYATLAHELGHVYCGHVGADPKGRWPDRRRLAASRAETAELEAEAAAWLVCQRNGVTTRSADYLSALIPQADLRKISLFTIYEAANRIEGRSATVKTA